VNLVERFPQETPLGTTWKVHNSLLDGASRQPTCIIQISFNSMSSSTVPAQVLGYISIGCWVVLFMPQIVLNANLKTGQGLSLATLLLWILGDSLGVASTILNKLQVTQITLAVFFLFIDGVLLAQILYYRKHSRQGAGVSQGGDLESLEVTPIESLSIDTKAKSRTTRTPSSMEDANSPTTAVVIEAPVLTRNPTGLSTPRQRSGTTMDARSHSILPPLNPRQSTGITMRSPSQVESGQPLGRSLATLRQMTSVLLAGLAEMPVAKGQRLTDTMRQGGKVVILPKNSTLLQSTVLIQTTQQLYAINPMADALGWACYTIYIFSRFPQISKNYSKESTCGLSKTTYLIRFVAQITYLLSIFLVSTDAAYLRVNLPWIVGTSVNFMLDMFIVGQMWYYGRHYNAGTVVQVPTYLEHKKDVYKATESITTVDEIAKTAINNC
jgi:uncharacterized protein with PQ loop repeat